MKIIAFALKCPILIAKKKSLRHIKSNAGLAHEAI